jgi:hypothetical protein
MRLIRLDFRTWGLTARDYQPLFTWISTADSLSTYNWMDLIISDYMSLTVAFSAILHGPIPPLRA